MASQDPGALLSGPRGRMLCWTLLWHRMAHPGHPLWVRVWAAAHAGDLTGDVGALAACVALADPWSAAVGEASLLQALARAVNTAAYWQQPHPEDRALAAPVVREALLPIAAAVAAAPAAQWWAAPLDRDRQQYVEWLGRGGPDHPGPPLSGAAAKLAAWRAATVAAEARAARERPADPAALISGDWWSTPALSGLATTTRALPGTGAAGLVLEEDSPGGTEAVCWPVRPGAGARVYEVRDPDDWAGLAGRYPLEVTASRRHDWWRAAGRDCRWLIPDFAAAASDYEAIHVSVAGYLATAGRALAVGDACTLLAGWDPDDTYWLADALSPAGPPTRWVRHGGDPAGWRPADR